MSISLQMTTVFINEFLFSIQIIDSQFPHMYALLIHVMCCDCCLYVWCSYTDGAPMIAHKKEGGPGDRYRYSTSIGDQNVGNSYPWGSATPATEPRTYAIRADLDPGEPSGISLLLTRVLNNLISRTLLLSKSRPMTLS